VAGNAEIRIVVAVVVEARLAREVATAVGPIVVVVSPSLAAGHRFSVPFAVSHPVLQVTDAGAPVEGVGLAAAVALAGVLAIAQAARAEISVVAAAIVAPPLFAEGTVAVSGAVVRAAAVPFLDARDGPRVAAALGDLVLQIAGGFHRVEAVGRATAVRGAGPLAVPQVRRAEVGVVPARAIELGLLREILRLDRRRQRRQGYDRDKDPPQSPAELGHD